MVYFHFVGSLSPLVGAAASDRGFAKDLHTFMRAFMILQYYSHCNKRRNRNNHPTLCSCNCHDDFF